MTRLEKDPPQGNPFWRSSVRRDFRRCAPTCCALRDSSCATRSWPKTPFRTPSRRPAPLFVIRRSVFAEDVGVRHLAKSDHRPPSASCTHGADLQPCRGRRWLGRAPGGALQRTRNVAPRGKAGRVAEPGGIGAKQAVLDGVRGLPRSSSREGSTGLHDARVPGLRLGRDLRAGRHHDDQLPRHPASRATALERVHREWLGTAGEFDMLSCKEVTELCSAEMERPLAAGEVLSLRLHLMMCSGCTTSASR